MSLPAYLLNSSAKFYAETNPEGSFGQPAKVLNYLGTAPVRVDMTGENRYLQDGNFEQRRRTFRVFADQVPPGVTTKTWLEVTGPVAGFTFLGQVESITYPGLMGHHAEMTVIENPPMEMNVGLQSTF